MKREYSVLFPLIYFEGEWKIVFERRSKNLKAHKGEISLPGGAMEEGETAREAAVRETSEELGVSSADISVIGEIEGTRTLRGDFIRCYIGILKSAEFEPSDAEVESLLFVPLNDVLAYPMCEEMLQAPGGQWVKSYYYDFGEHRIWGITGRLLKHFVDSFEQVRMEMTYISEEM